MTCQLLRETVLSLFCYKINVFNRKSRFLIANPDSLIGKQDSSIEIAPELSQGQPDCQRLPQHHCQFHIQWPFFSAKVTQYAPFLVKMCKQEASLV